jgi:hypothetical protein
MVEDVKVGPHHIRNTYYSLTQFAEGAAERYNESIDDLYRAREWRGANLPDAVNLATFGWDGAMPEALTAAEAAVKTVEKDHELTTFRQVWDVAGSVVDVPLYLAGQPECMIEYPVAPTVKTGRVITLCASMSISGSISPENITARGQVITAFALALSKLGYSLELWLDFTTAVGDYAATVRVMVKGANDVLDPSKVQFAFAHPAVLRALGFAWAHGLPATYRQRLGIGGSYGRTCEPDHDLPEGTIYLGRVCSGNDKPELARDLLDLLVKSGVITE